MTAGIVGASGACFPYGTNSGAFDRDYATDPGFSGGMATTGDPVPAARSNDRETGRGGRTGATLRGQDSRQNGGRDLVHRGPHGLQDHPGATWRALLYGRIRGLFSRYGLCDARNSSKDAPGARYLAPPSPCPELAAYPERQTKAKTGQKIRSDPIPERDQKGGKGPVPERNIYGFPILKGQIDAGNEKRYGRSDIEQKRRDRLIRDARRGQASESEYRCNE